MTEAELEKHDDQGQGEKNLSQERGFAARMLKRLWYGVLDLIYFFTLAPSQKYINKKPLKSTGFFGET